MFVPRNRNHYRYRYPYRCFVAGYSLLEVLIALFILAFGLLSVVYAGSAALRRTHDAYLHGLAAIEATNLIEAAEAGDADNDYYNAQWRAKLAVMLPDGKGSLRKVKGGHKSSVCWKARFAPMQKGAQCVSLEGNR